MKVFAYCDQRYVQATREASGVEPFTSPPVETTTFEATCGDALRAAELVYFNLHAGPGNHFWANMNGTIALDEATVMRLDLRGKIVFMVNCFAGGAMLVPLSRRGPRAIVGGFGENLGGVSRLAGADLLGLWFRRALNLGFSIPLALSSAKTRLMVGAQTASVKDALGFEILYRETAVSAN